MGKEFLPSIMGTLASTRCVQKEGCNMSEHTEREGKIVLSSALPAKVVVYPRTRLSKEQPQVLTRLTFDLSQLSWDDVLTYAIARVTIQWQDKKRAKQLDIPTEEEVVVPKPGTRGAVTFDAQAALVKGFGLEMAKRLVKKHGSAEAAFAAVAALLDEEEGEEGETEA